MEVERARGISEGVTGSAVPAGVMVSGASSTPEKLALFRSLFRGREDVFPKRWENAKSGKSGYSPVCANDWTPPLCAKPQVKCGQCPNQAFTPMSDEIMRAHLVGHRVGSSADFTAGVYPLLLDDRCWFAAVDFDKSTWMEDIAAFRETARSNSIDVAVERSRSGNGAHAWLFFEQPVLAADARRLAATLVTMTLDRRPDLGFGSYDRIFPSQDTMPVGGFGNLIALPLQSRPRQSGNSLFVDDDFTPHDDQWAYLSSLRRIPSVRLSQILRDNAAADLGLAIPLPTSTREDDEPWKALPSHRTFDPPIEGKLPSSVKLVLANQIYIERSELPPGLVSRMARLAAFQNPEFYAAQAMRFSVFGIPRVIFSGQLFTNHLSLPRGCLEGLMELLEGVGIKAEISDKRQNGTPLAAQFLGELTPDQVQAVSALAPHDAGVLAAATAFGKTVVAAKMVAERGTNTLILVHRKQLAGQWMAQLKSFLDIDPSCVGVIGGGKRKPTGIIDVAVIQSLIQKGVVSDMVADYGHLIVDECHHISAVSFEAIAREAKARYVLGLSATPTRRDGHHPIIFMQCGPIRYSIRAKTQAAKHSFEHKYFIRSTGVRYETDGQSAKPSIAELYAYLSHHERRNAQIVDDVVAAVSSGRSPIVITERRDHLSLLSDELSKRLSNVIALHGGLGTRAARSAAESIRVISEDQERVIVATGRYLGEGFDDPRLDTLFLTLPVSWRGTLAQYSGRLHRAHHLKREVVIFDYVDDEPILARMASKREAGYRNLGYAKASEKELWL